MIVDVHAHYFRRGYIPRAFHAATAEIWAKGGAGRKPEDILPTIEEGLIDDDGKMFIDNMNRAGVDATVIMTADFGRFWTGEDHEVPPEEQFRFYGEL